ncbi:hypothetical protein ACFQX6_19315 [Streptosporangium lutulentum]
MTGAANAKPTVAFPSKVVETSSYKVLTPGTVGAPAKEGGSVVANFTVFTWDGKENKMAGSTYDDGGPQVIALDAQVPEVLRKGFTETKGGGRFMSVVAKDALPAEQQAQVPPARRRSSWSTWSASPRARRPRAPRSTPRSRASRWRTRAATPRPS